jgi:hypothetical protein
MIVQMALGNEHPATDLAFVVPLAHVGLHMNVKVAFLCEAISADKARKWLLSLVFSLMN